ncbi:MAG: hypothetical protein IT377_33630 [Polyangiaceae bacterium]|nr:hypothetical protein [Polyangiaceae bacterium]
MRRPRAIASVALALAVAVPCLAACGSSGPTGPGGTSGTPLAEGTVVGAGTEAGKVAVAWIVSSGSPDYTYSFGGGEFDGTKFVVSFDGTPPLEAVNSYGVGVGLLVLLAPGTAARPTGKFDFDEIDGAITAISAQHAIIWKDASKEGLDWSAPLPAGFSCGKCAPGAPGSSFDSYVQTDCSTLELVPGSTSKCNWT